MGKNPAFLFYPADWIKDPCLNRCSMGARGLWITLLCLLWECPVRGKFCDEDGTPWPDDDIGTLAGHIGTDWRSLLAELERKGVARRDDRGALFSKRMVEDEKQRTYERDKKKKQRCPPTCPPVVPEENEGTVTETGTVTVIRAFKEELPAVLKVEEKTLVIAPNGVDQCVEEIQAAWKKPMGYLGMQACLEAFNFEAKKKQMEFLQAAKYVRDKTLIISALLKEWPPGEQKYIPKLTDFMAGQQYENEFSTWERNGDGGKKSMLTF